MPDHASRKKVSGWTIARPAGIELRVHPTFLVLIGLVLVGLFGPPLDGVLWLAMVFSSIVAHELGHAIVARRRGMVVRDIVLLPIGGASEIDDLPDRPDDELAVAIAGPLVSVGIAVGLAVALVLTQGSVGAPSLAAGGIAERMLWTNVMLAAFNLLPALPMDGGRVLRAALARRTGFSAATRTAARLSRRLAAAMAVVGFLYMPWLLLIAAFVYVSGRAEEAAALVHERLAGVLVRDVMVPVGDQLARPGQLTVRADETAEDAVKELADAGEQRATVVDASGQCVGMFLLDSLTDRFRDAA